MTRLLAVVLLALYALPASADGFLVVVLRDPAGDLRRANVRRSAYVVAPSFAGLLALRPVRRIRASGAHLCARRLHGVMSTGRKEIDRQWRCVDGDNAPRLVP